MTIEEYFEQLSSKIDPQDLEGINTKINFDLKDKLVYLEVKDQKITTFDGRSEDAEVSITSTAEDLLSIIKGDTNPMMAMMMGKLKISNPAAMMKYAKILGLM
jgi:putative sterol carrier protein